MKVPNNFINFITECYSGKNLIFINIEGECVNFRDSFYNRDEIS